MTDSKTQASHQSPKVLIVEDEAIIARDIQMQLTDSGFTVTGTAQSAEDAFAAIEKDRPDIVLMDIRLKGAMDGVEAAGIVRSRYTLPLIYLTAHADEGTLQRAQITEPFGYIVKPLGHANIKATITMALYKHRMERELEDHRSFLSATLQSLPDAVLVADVAGQILLLNPSAERLTGWRHDEAIGKSVFQVVAIRDKTGRSMSQELLVQALSQSSPVLIPRDCALVNRQGQGIEVSGQMAVTSAENRAAGVFITLQDVTLRKREDQRLRQEQQMFVAGELACGVAREFYSLFDLIADAADGLVETKDPHELALIRDASKIGIQMSTQLIELREGHGTTRVANVHQYMLAAQSLLQRLCGSDVRLQMSAPSNVGYVLSTGVHFEQLLLHLVSQGKQQVHGHGTLTLTADIHTQASSSWKMAKYVRLSIQGRSSQVVKEELPVIAASGGDAAELDLAIVRAIATAAEGFVRVTEPNEFTSLIEVFLPWFESYSDASAVTQEYPQIILLVGLPVRATESLRHAAGESRLLLEAASLDEAAAISELYHGDIDLMMLNSSRFLRGAKERTCERIRARRPDTAFLEVASSEDDPSAPALNLAALEQDVKEILRRRGPGTSRSVSEPSQMLSR